MLKFSNFGKAKIASAPVGVSGLSFTVEAGKGLLFPSLVGGDYFYGVFKDASGNREVVKIESRATDSLQIAVGGRGLDGTTARTWAAGDYFVLSVTNIALQESLSNPNLAAMGTLPAAADKLPYFNGASSMALADFTPFARAVLDDADAPAARQTLGAAPADIIPSGTPMLFYKDVAPVGWTQVTTFDNRALRVVSGAGAGSGGTVDFSAAFASQALVGSVGLHNLTVDEMPPHFHTYDRAQIGGGLGNGGSAPGSGYGIISNTSTVGSGVGHNHSFTGSINLGVKYVDIIIASRN